MADEVRKLAERSQRGTKAIADLIRDVQAGTRDAVEAMGHGERRVREGAEQAGAAGGALTDISTAVDKTAHGVEEIARAAAELTARADATDTMIGGIATSTGEALATAHEMSTQVIAVGRLVGSIAAVAEENSAATEQMSAATEQMSAATEQMSAATEQMSASTEQMSAGAEEIIDRARGLAAMAGRLGGLTDAFRFEDEAPAPPAAERAASAPIRRAAARRLASAV